MCKANISEHVLTEGGVSCFYMMILNLMTIWVLITGATALERQDSKSEILEESNSNDGSGNYQFSFKTSNGLLRMETGELTTDYDGSQKYVVRGYYSYIDTDGNEVIYHYKADENGFVILKPEIGVLQSFEFFYMKDSADDKGYSHEISPLVLASILGGSG